MRRCNRCNYRYGRKGNWSSLVKSVFCLLFLISCQQRSFNIQEYESDTLRIQKLGDNIYIHTSFIDLGDGSLFPCNGLLHLDNGEATIFDTPVSEYATIELLELLENQKIEVRGVVVNHFHNDCLGGLEVCHRRNIPSYANIRTIEMASSRGIPTPQNSLDKLLTLQTGDQFSKTYYFGPGHTVDNVVSYFPEQAVLFGGCLIKSDGAGKGNLADASPREWAVTVQKIKESLPDIQTVVPGHGKHGGPEFLDYTISLFRPDEGHNG